MGVPFYRADIGRLLCIIKNRKFFLYFGKLSRNLKWRGINEYKL
jgi:hypothetical protein